MEALTVVPDWVGPAVVAALVGAYLAIGLVFAVMVVVRSRHHLAQMHRDLGLAETAGIVAAALGLTTALWPIHVWPPASGGLADILLRLRQRRRDEEE